MNRVLPAGVAALLILSSPVLAQSAAPAAGDQSMMTAAGFVQTAGVSNLFEIESSRMAMQRTRDTAVTAFAQQMVVDHTEAGEELAAVVGRSTAGVAVPATLDTRHFALLEELAQAEGQRFEADYVRMQVQAHQEAVALFTTYAQSGDDPALQAFATKTLPLLRHHLEEIRQIAEQAS